MEQKSPRPDWGLERCITCYMCLAGCPVYSDHPDLFLGPVGIVKLGNMLFNRVDVADRVKIAAHLGVHHCDLCGTCQDVCPQHIKIIPLMRLLKSRSAKRNLLDKHSLPTKSLNEMTDGLL